MPCARIVPDIQHRRRVVAWCIAFGVYFLPLLLSKWVPSMGATVPFFLYLVSIPLVLLAAVGVLMFGAIGWAISSARSRPVRPSAPSLIIVPLTAILIFGLVFGLRAIVADVLPTGSYAQAFEAEAWQSQESAELVRGDITPRQKMLGAVVQEVLPGSHRSQIEDALGPSLDTPYFRSNGRDLIYRTGLERDSLFGIDSEWLLIWLDEAGHFSRFAIMVD